MPANRVQIPFVVDTLEENPPEEGKFVSRPVVGATVTVKSRTSEASVTVYGTEKEPGAVVPTTDSNGRINGWVEEGAYTITVTGGKPFIAATTYAWDALSGRGIENGRVGAESIWKSDLRKDTNHNDTQSALEFLLPTGASLNFYGETAPSGFLLEDGKKYSTTEYNRLFKVIGYKYGGSGSEFAVPDSRGRVNVGAGSGPGLTVRTLAAKEGAETVALTVGQLAPHTHTQTPVGGSASVSGSVSGTLGGTIADHTHQPPGNFGGRSYMNHAEPGDENAAKRFLSKDAAGETQVLWGNAGWGNATGSVNGTVGCAVSGTLGGSMSGSITTNAGTTTSTGSGESHSNMQPLLVANKIIKT
jgi:microcystin-dependent protein